MKQNSIEMVESNYTESMLAEARVIDNALVDPSCLPDIRSIVLPHMFQYPHFHELWLMVNEAWNAGSPLDAAATIVNVKDKDAKNLLIHFMGNQGVIEPIESAHNLREVYINQKAVEHGIKMSRIASEGVTDSSKIMKETRNFLSVLEGCYAQKNTRKLSEAIRELDEKLEEVRNNYTQGKRTYIPTGFQFLDNYFKGGLRDGNVMVLAARPGVGKTSVCLSMILSMARFGFRVKIYSMEMPSFELAEKIMYNLGGLRPYMMQTGDIDRPKWESARAEALKYNILIEDSMNNIDDILADATIAHQKGECDVIFLDHLRLIRSSDNRTNANIYARTCEITGKLKAFALQRKMPVVYACQLNRDSVREDRDPDLQDLRDSGSIEEDADKIVFLKRNKIAENDFQIKMIIGKHRQGGGAYEHIFLNPNDTYSGFTESTEDRSPDEDAKLDNYLKSQNSK